MCSFDTIGRRLSQLVPAFSLLYSSILLENTENMENKLDFILGHVLQLNERLSNMERLLPINFGIPPTSGKPHQIFPNTISLPISDHFTPNFNQSGILGRGSGSAPTPRRDKSYIGNSTPSTDNFRSTVKELYRMTQVTLHLDNWDKLPKTIRQTLKIVAQNIRPPEPNDELKNKIETILLQAGESIRSEIRDYLDHRRTQHESELIGLTRLGETDLKRAKNIAFRYLNDSMGKHIKRDKISALIENFAGNFCSDTPPGPSTPASSPSPIRIESPQPMSDRELLEYNTLLEPDLFLPTPPITPHKPRESFNTSESSLELSMSIPSSDVRVTNPTKPIRDAGLSRIPTPMKTPPTLKPCRATQQMDPPTVMSKSCTLLQSLSKCDDVFHATFRLYLQLQFKKSDVYTDRLYKSWTRSYGFPDHLIQAFREHSECPCGHTSCPRVPFR